MPYNRARQDNWWKRRTKLERHLAYIALGSLFLALVLFISLIFYRQYGVPKGVCLSAGCVRAASEIFEKLDEKVDPCDDFYNFACGGYIEKKRIPDDSPQINTFTEVSDNVNRQLRSLLEEPVDSSDIHATQVVKTYYKACMNEEFINQEGLSEAQTLLNTLGGWPVLEEAWDSSTFDWIEQIKLLKENGLNIDYLLKITAGKDFGNSSLRIININQPAQFGMQIYRLKKNIHDPIVRQYLQLMVDFAVMFGANDFKASEDLQEVLNLEVSLAKITASFGGDINVTHFYNKVTLKQLNQRYGSIDWNRLLGYVLPEEVKLYDEKELLVEVPSYINALEKLLKNTPRRTLANYFMWRVVLQISFFLPQKFSERFMPLQKLMNGVSEIPPRWKVCLALTIQSAPIMLSATYVRKFFEYDTKRNAEEMIEFIMSTFKKNVQSEASWMDEKTKLAALEKADQLITKVAFDDGYFDDKILTNMFSGIFAGENVFLQTYLNINKNKLNRTLNKLLDPVRRGDWTETTIPIEVNTLYFPLDNAMVLPAAILQGEFFSKDRPSFLNYGAIGSIIGHEIIHAFDKKGSQFDGNGNLKNWWNNETRTTFDEKAKCFVERFSKFKVDHLRKNVNGVNTLNENIADNGGTKQAYLAYDSWADEYGEESKLPSLDYTPRQLFWISAAQIWCNKETIEHLKRKLTTDVHTPQKYRVNGNFQNIEFFAKDFKCSLGSGMNPSNKCSIW